MDVKPAPDPASRTEQVVPTTEYRVVLWEQPEIEDIEPESIGWGERTVDLVDVGGVQEAIEWAEQQLMTKQGPYSSSDVPVRDREYVIYAKVPGEERFLQIAGWDPTVPGLGNLKRVG